MSDKYKAIVVGSGFGGAVVACRLAKRFGKGSVLVLERGKRYPKGSFPRSPNGLANNFWNTEFERRVRPQAIERVLQRGLFDVRYYNNLDVVLAAGLGGGSLIYANVFMEPPAHVFSHPWPQSCLNGTIDPYYRVCKEVLGARPLPRPKSNDPNDARHIQRTHLFEKHAREHKRNSKPVDIAVFFGNDYARIASADPLPLGHQEKNRYGALQTSCLYCAECDIGCNYHAKNSLDLNYLYMAEQHGAEILTEHSCYKVEPINNKDFPVPDGDGTHGFRVSYYDLATAKNRFDLKYALTERVVLSAGALGSTELLLRCRDEFASLPKLSGKLGHGMSANGDFLGFVAGTKTHVDSNRGPVITQRTDFNLFEGFNSEHAFILEDASYPYLLSWFVEGVKTGLNPIDSLIRFSSSILGRLRPAGHIGRLGHAFRDLFSTDITSRSCVLLFMGLDSSDGVMTLGDDSWLSIDWPLRKNRKLYEKIVEAGERFARDNDGVFYPLPTYNWPFRRNVSVHPLGGCALSDNPDRGVTSADLKGNNFGQVHGYQNLYVADGAIIPAAVGANPSATIAALSEMIAQSIITKATGRDIMPTANL